MALPVRPAGALLLLLIAFAATPAAASSGVALQITAGIGGYGRLGAWLPLSVDVENGGPPVEADLAAAQASPPTSPAPPPPGV